MKYLTLTGIWLWLSGGVLQALSDDYIYENQYCNHYDGTPTDTCFGTSDGKEYKYTCIDEDNMLYSEYNSGECDDSNASPTMTETLDLFYESTGAASNSSNFDDNYYIGICDDSRDPCEYFVVNYYSSSSSNDNCDGSYETVFIRSQNGCYYDESNGATYRCEGQLLTSWETTYVDGQQQCWGSGLDSRVETDTDYATIYEAQENSNDCYEFVCSDSKYVYPDLNLDDEGFFTNADYEFIDGQCNHYDEAPLNVCMGVDYDETEYYITCQDTENIIWYKYNMGDCVSNTETPELNSIASYSFPVNDIDDYLTATCNAASDCNYFIFNNFDYDAQLPGFCYGNYRSYQTLLTDVCYYEEESGYSAMFGCDGSIISGTGYSSSDCSGDPVSTFDGFDMAKSFTYDQSLEECYQFNCNGAVTDSK